jgi:hypothetical protein
MPLHVQHGRCAVEPDGCVWLQMKNRFVGEPAAGKELSSPLVKTIPKSSVAILFYFICIHIEFDVYNS